MKSLQEWSKECAEVRINKGFFTPHGLESLVHRDLMLGKLMLVVSEISEAAEAVRSADTTNFKEEIADTFIRLFDICGTMDLNIELEIERKMATNRNRPALHNKQTSL